MKGKDDGSVHISQLQAKREIASMATDRFSFGFGGIICSEGWVCCSRLGEKE